MRLRGNRENIFLPVSLLSTVNFYFPVNFKRTYSYLLNRFIFCFGSRSECLYFSRIQANLNWSMYVPYIFGVSLEYIFQCIHFSSKFPLTITSLNRGHTGICEHRKAKTHLFSSFQQCLRRAFVRDMKYLLHIGLYGYITHCNYL